jgi:hypothetical protein
MGVAEGLKRHCDAYDLANILANILTSAGRGRIAPRMMNAATIAIARRRRTFAVWADVCV